MAETDNQGPQFDDDSGELLSRIHTWDRHLDSHWSQWRTQTRLAYDFVAGRQWTPDEEAQFEEDGRIAAVVNRIETTIDAVTGAEIMGRQEVTYLPRTVDDTGPTDVLSQGAQYVRQNCDAEDEESDAFRDCLICGVGWTESRPSYEVDLDGEIIIDRIDPMEMSVDPSSRKANFADARYIRREIKMSREEAEQQFPDIEDFDGVDGADARQPTIVDPQVRYKNGDVEEAEDEVIVREYQWFDEEPVYRLSVGPQTVELTKYDPPEDAPDHEKMEGYALPEGPWGPASIVPEDAVDALVKRFNGVKQKRRVYRKCFVAAGRIFDLTDIEVGEFTYKGITGKRDRNKGTYYGLVKPMMDPQRFANTAASALMNQYRVTSKGGVMVEAGAVEDVRNFESTWADNSSVTWVQDGALSGQSGPKIVPKPTSQISPAIPAILEFAINGIRDTTGVNLELLGMADRQQAGVLEHQRKQAAYGILSSFFNSIRRYRKMQGRLLLKLMKLYLPEGTLVRIVGDDGQGKYVPMAYQGDVMKYDVIVDEAPMSPNQKERTFAILSQFQGLLGEASPQILAEFIRYSPLPANVAEKIAGMLNAPPDPAQQQAAQEAQQLQMAGAQQEVRKTASEATKNEAQAAAAASDAQRSDAEAARDLTEALFNDTAKQALENTGAVDV